MKEGAITEKDIVWASVAYNEYRGKLNVLGGPSVVSDEEYIAFNKNPAFIAGAKWVLERLASKDETHDLLKELRKVVGEL